MLRALEVVVKDRVTLEIEHRFQKGREDYNHPRPHPGDQRLEIVVKGRVTLEIEHSFQTGED